MGILSWLVMGFIVGLPAKSITPGKDPGGVIITILIGIAGAFAGDRSDPSSGWGR
ncbi:MAG TPA: hypothetical protein P5244_09685 [Syntrophales bacterium]|nr:hypothetical protein [Syntrophales bacterium]